MAAIGRQAGAAGRLGLLLLLVGCSATRSDDHSVSPHSGHAKGASDAAEAAAAGNLALKEYPPLPYPPGHREYLTLLRERYGVAYEVPQLPPGVSEAEFVREVRGWNEVMESEVKRRFGADIFDRLQQEAGERYRAQVQPGGERE